MKEMDIHLKIYFKGIYEDILKGGRELKNPKNLTLKQKKFLESQGLNADEFLIIAAPVDYYKFYHVLSGKEVIIRR